MLYYSEHDENKYTMKNDETIVQVHVPFTHNNTRKGYAEMICWLVCFNYQTFLQSLHTDQGDLKLNAHLIESLQDQMISMLNIPIKLLFDINPPPLLLRFKESRWLKKKFNSIYTIGPQEREHDIQVPDHLVRHHESHHMTKTLSQQYIYNNPTIWSTNVLFLLFLHPSSVKISSSSRHLQDLHFPNH